mmetsp:Transcript_3967/g.15350  ORF Transcript_3967/g.15350 Transcript_3967/m.15350 type:complete len:223 (+) Transcript_3967:2380-3048(+)
MIRVPRPESIAFVQQRGVHRVGQRVEVVLLPLRPLHGDQVIPRSRNLSQPLRWEPPKLRRVPHLKRLHQSFIHRPHEFLHRHLIVRLPIRLLVDRRSQALRAHVVARPLHVPLHRPFLRHSPLRLLTEQLILLILLALHLLKLLVRHPSRFHQPSRARPLASPSARLRVPSSPSRAHHSPRHRSRAHRARERPSIVVFTARIPAAVPRRRHRAHRPSPPFAS